MQELLKDPATVKERELIDQIIIPVKVPGAWILYTTQRQAHSQCVVRLNKCYREKTVEINEANEIMDNLMGGLGRGVMSQWLNTLAMQSSGQDVHQALVRSMAVADAKDKYYRKLRDTQFSFDEISQGMLALNVIHAMLTTGED